MPDLLLDVEKDKKFKDLHFSKIPFDELHFSIIIKGGLLKERNGLPKDENKKKM